MRVVGYVIWDREPAWPGAWAIKEKGAQVTQPTAAVTHHSKAKGTQLAFKHDIWL